MAYTANSRQMVDTLNTYQVQTGSCAFQGDEWGVDFYHITNPAQPRVYVHHAGVWTNGHGIDPNHSGGGTGDGLQYALNDYGGVPLPSGWSSDQTRKANSSNADGQVTIWDEPNDLLYDFWGMTKDASGNPFCATGGVMQGISTHRGYPQQGDYKIHDASVTINPQAVNHGYPAFANSGGNNYSFNVATFHAGDTLPGFTNSWNASGGSLPSIGGCIQLAELEQAVIDQLATADGVIPHALMHATAGYKSGWVWPSQRSDGNLVDNFTINGQPPPPETPSNDKYLPNGARLVIKPSVNVNGLSISGGSTRQNAVFRVLARTLQQFGSYQRDNSGGGLQWNFTSGRPSQTDSQVINDSRYFNGLNREYIMQLPWSQMEIMAMCPFHAGHGGNTANTTQCTGPT